MRRLRLLSSCKTTATTSEVRALARDVPMCDAMSSEDGHEICIKSEHLVATLDWFRAGDSAIT